MTFKRYILLLAEGVEDKIKRLSKKYSDIPEDKIREYSEKIDPSPSKLYLDWILLVIRKTGKHPSNADNYHETLSKFHLLKQNHDFLRDHGDIYHYKSIQELEQLVNNNSEISTKGQQFRKNKQNGLRLVRTKDDLKLYLVTTLEAGIHLGWRRTKWCVKDKKWFDTYASKEFWCLTKNDEPFKLFHQKTGQLATTDNSPTTYDEFEIVGFSKPKETILSSPKLTCQYVINFLDKKRVPEFENVIAQDAKYSYKYVTEVLDKKRVPEFENVIAQDAEYSFRYARSVLRGRFIEGEKAIAQNAEYSYQYLQFLRKRIPEFENVIAQDAEYSYYYATNVLKGRFIEGEKHSLSKNSGYYGEMYKRYLNSRKLHNRLLKFLDDNI